MYTKISYIGFIVESKFGPRPAEIIVWEYNIESKYIP